MRKTMILLVLLGMFLAACSPPTSPAPQETPTPAQNVLAGTATDTAIPPTSTQPPATVTSEPTATQAPTNTPTPQPANYGPNNFPANIDPLTGLPAADPALLSRRPVAVKVQMFPRGERPPWGISLADIVFDYYQNNGLTRLHAIFYGNDAKQVGPIRSGRLLDIILVNLYRSVFAFGSADQRIYSRLMSAGFSDRLVIEGSHNCPPLCRIDPNGFNYLVTNTSDLSKYITTQGVKNDRQSLNGMTFKTEFPQGGAQGTQVSTRYSISAYNRWDYDLPSGRYLRSQDTQEDTGQGEAYAPLVDRLTEKQVAADNVVILVVPHEYYYRRGSSEIIDIKLAGKGPAYAFRDGQIYSKLSWNASPDSVLYLTNPDGSVYAYKPGVTWYQVIGQSSKVVDTQKGKGVWRFESSIP